MPAARADRLATARTARPRPGTIAEAPLLRSDVADTLALRWSPQQISRRPQLDHPGDAGMRVCHATTYTFLFVQTTAVLHARPNA